MTDDPVLIGLNIREKPDGKSEKLGILPRGARIEIGKRSENGKWGQISKILSGEIGPVVQGGTALPSANNGWLFLAELDAGPKKPAQLDSIVIPTQPISIKAGDLIGHMGEYQEYVDAQSPGKRGVRPLLHLEVFTGDDAPKFIEKSRAYAKSLPAGSGSLFVIEKGAKLVAPFKSNLTLGPADAVLAARSASQESIWIKVFRVQKKVMEKKELGTYDAAIKGYKNGTVWAGWYVGAKDDQRTQSEAESKKLGYTRREVLAATGDPLWVERSTWSGGASQEKLGKSIPAWTIFPLDVKNQKAPTVDFPRVISRAELYENPAEHHMIDPAGNHWWYLSARSNQNAKEPAIAGWVCEKGHEKVSWQSPWAWPGFEHIEEVVKPIDLFANQQIQLGRAKKEELTDFKARADKVENSELIKKLYMLLDINKDNHIDKQEIMNAMKQPLLAQAMSRIIAKYESEWGGEMSKWNELDPLMQEGKLEWQAEKIRIDNLRWWPKVVGKVKDFPSSPQVHHINPIALLGNFYLIDPKKTTSSGGPTGKSGAEWVKYFLPSSKVSDLKKPFQDHIAKFIAALEAGGVSVNINTTLRPPQRSYLMYYAREIKLGNLSPDKVPAFVPRNDDAPVNIDWAHRDSNGKADLVAAKKAAAAMDAKYGAAGAIGKHYESNHNGGEAIDMKFVPAWGVGKTVKNANGKEIKIGSKQDILDIGKTYKVIHWNNAGVKRKKNDDPHWSITGG